MATSGFSRPVSARNAWPDTRSYSPAPLLPARRSSNSEMSAPDTNAVSPSPRMTTTRTSSSLASASTAAGIWRHISADTALRRAGWSKTIHPSAPSFSLPTCPLIAAQCTPAASPASRVRRSQGGSDRSRSQSDGSADTGMNAAAPPVLLIDDGELVTVRQLLEELGADFESVVARDAGRSLPQPTRLLLVSARAAHSLRIERTLTPTPNRATWMAFVSGDSKTQRLALQKAGFDFLIREPVHPTALRVLFHRALFRGSDTRKTPRVACGYTVKWRTGLWPRRGMLVDLS